MSDQQRYLLSQDRVDLNDINALETALYYARSQRQSYTENGTRSPASTIALVRACVEAANQAEIEGKSKVRIVRDGRIFDMTAGEINAYIVGITAGAYQAGLVNREQVNSMTDGLASNNWDELVRTHEWAGLEALSHTAAHFTDTLLGRALSDLSKADKDTLRSLAQPGHDILTRFAAQTQFFIHGLRDQYRNVPKKRAEVDARLQNENRNVLIHRNRNTEKVTFGNQTVLTRLQAYAYLAALSCYQRELPH